MRVGRPYSFARRDRDHTRRAVIRLQGLRGYQPAQTPTGRSSSSALRSWIAGTVTLIVHRRASRCGRQVAAAGR
jgi:hypothetical protein